ncbi:ThiF family adenylyltransferase [Klebsiella pneumoniae]|uniref:ThiF family adenylyltransferase n=1 Tax=Klebsiella pneumoniae TaxID=573 RepID=UPI002852995D|nr:ThiF family adenylyltransferase [Klebsiella pneumoniae]WMW13801.1 hypothetical protein NW906_27665 [Klebsiella pneumoniae]
MGSKIATSLARSGIKRFLLVDDDYLATSNIVRHELYWNHVGKHKVGRKKCTFTDFCGY